MTETKALGYSRSPNPDARSVLIAIDSSKHSKHAFDYYLKWLLHPDDAITIYHAIEPISLPSFSMINPNNLPTDEWTRIVQKRIKNVEQLELDYASECQNKHLVFRFLHESVEHIGESIVSQAHKNKAQLIILGTRGMGAIKRTIIGSVSDYVIHHTSIAVCIVPVIN